MHTSGASFYANEAHWQKKIIGLFRELVKRLLIVRKSLLTEFMLCVSLIYSFPFLSFSLFLFSCLLYQLMRGIFSFATVSISLSYLCCSSICSCQLSF